MVRSTPEIAPLLQVAAPHQRDGVSPPTYDLCIGFQSWNLVASKPRPYHYATAACRPFQKCFFRILKFTIVSSNSKMRNLSDLSFFRLWAEVFHVSSSTGAARWQQVSEDLVPVNITCIQDSPECIFHITAYNSQVEKILDVKLVQPGTRLGQASECFVYWKDPTTGDTWGLNFTSPVDAKQFRDCCAFVNISWRHPSAHSWYRSEGSSATIHFKGDRKDQTALARLTSGHLKTLRFSRGDKEFNICTKCNMIEATPQHLLDCVALV
ncbi:Protein still life, isoform SIF type 1 [Araneus ventricosus]|uniref:Protein still life, isoform SIF type 1 n=1 Tax=Araneus ventricosus TaxID=182803 RepID=A0A4Y2FDA8_ARAVE|nr:Protein still life, isoform SIF type 1 [Araneus ventricosus]